VRKWFKVLADTCVQRYVLTFFAHICLLTLGPIRAALASQDIFSYTKFAPTQSCETLPLKHVVW